MFKDVSLFFLLLLTVFCSGTVRADSESDTLKNKKVEKYEKLSLFVGLDYYVLRDSAGMGASVGVAYINENSVLALRATRLIDVFDRLEDSVDNFFLGDEETNSADDTLISEVSLVYGKKLDDFVLSLGVGSLKAKNMADDYVGDDDRFNFSVTGLVYSVAWGGPYVGGSIELSGNLNSEENLHMISLLLYF